MKKILAFSLASGLLAACGGSGSNSPQYGVFGSITPSPLSYQAALIGLSPPDAEPVASSNLAATETDSLNPANAVSVSVSQTADAEPLALGPLPATAADPEKPNS